MTWRGSTVTLKSMPNSHSPQRAVFIKQRRLKFTMRARNNNNVKLQLYIQMRLSANRNHTQQCPIYTFRGFSFSMRPETTTIVVILGQARRVESTIQVSPCSLSLRPTRRAEGLMAIILDKF